ncbi:MAG: TVP38/TMEM64 family protein [Coriobacteriia bacterium]|nr:TVP38/TMEM64 family protein [Coriobacteriia bacterium]
MAFSTSLLITVGIIAGVVTTYFAVRDTGHGAAGARAARIAVGFIAVGGGVSVAHTLFTSPYAAETVAIIWLEGLGLRDTIPSSAMVIPGLAIVAAGTIVGAVWAVKGWREQQAALAELGPDAPPPLVSRKQIITASVVIATAFLAYNLVPGIQLWVATAIDVLARGDIEYVRDFLLGFGVWAPVVSAALMILQSIVAPLPAFVVTFSNGLLFGWAWGALLSWLSAMAGAALCFWIARSFGRPVVERLAGGSAGLEVSDLFFERYGDRAVLIARLLPFVSFDIISYGAGLTPIRFWRFIWATGLGQLPATIVYSYLGQNLTGSVRVLFLVFLFTAVVFVAGTTVRPYFMARLQAQRDAAKAANPELAGESES